jgi:dolichyl-phosphate beta-glucosyltransferase
MKHLSIVIPAYNEEARIKATLENIHNFMKTKDYVFEVTIVDDGSSDNTAQVALESILYKEGKLKLIKNEINRGKGYSVKKGIISSMGDYILFSDADLSTPIEELDKLFDFIGKGYDIVIGSRALAGSDVRVHQPWYREAMGKVFNFFVRTILIKRISDTQCGFKLFKSSVAKGIASDMKTVGFSFDVEMLYLAMKNRYRIKEVPVIWLNSPKSKVNPVLDSTRMFFDLIRIKLIHG